MSNARETRDERTQRRRSEILAGAREVFLRDGYNAAKLTSVAAEAGCSVGTLYTYFRDRADLLAAVLDDLEDQMRHPGGRLSSDRPAAEKISAANRAYLEAYRRNHRMMALMEQVAMSDEDIADRRIRRAEGFFERNTRALQRFIDDGVVTDIDDPEMVAMTLSAAVSRLAYATWIEKQFPDTDETFERVCTAADIVWLRTLNINQ